MQSTFKIKCLWGIYLSFKLLEYYLKKLEEFNMKIDFIISYINRYQFGHEKDFVPPITGIHMAAITPDKYNIRVIHQQIESIDFNSDADVIAISFFSGFAPEAYRVAKEFRQRGKVVIGGGPHVTFNQEEALVFFDAIVTGEAESVWQILLNDIENKSFNKIYIGDPLPMDKIPTPRYDLLSDRFFIKKVIQATRGCPYKCSFCSVPGLNPGFRYRPVKEVINDAAYDDFKHWWQRKIVWFWDDNLTIDRKYIKELLVQLTPMKKWWLTQASIDIVKDKELLDLLKKSGCIGVFLGIESFGQDSLRDANKMHNGIVNYKSAVKELHRRGIAVMAGFITGFDNDTDERIQEISENIMKIGIDVPFISIMTPFKGTDIFETLKNEKRLIQERSWKYYNGYNVAFNPRQLTAEQLLISHRNLWKKAFSIKFSFARIIRSMFYLRPGAFLLVLFMNSFYCLKRVRNNLPVDMSNNYKYS
jgi:radical SAM superfamily enzyme YgiQ (UPF0313 family)